MRPVVRYLIDLANRKFWGDVRIRFKDGKIIQVVTTQEHVVETLPNPVTLTDAQVRELLQPAKRTP